MSGITKCPLVIGFVCNADFLTTIPFEFYRGKNKNKDTAHTRRMKHLCHELKVASRSWGGEKARLL